MYLVNPQLRLAVYTNYIGPPVLTAVTGENSIWTCAVVKGIGPIE